MSLQARLYSFFIIVVGAGILMQQLSHWEIPDPTRYVCYMGMAVAVSRLRVSLPSIFGGMSLFLVFVLFGVMEFTLAETLFMGCMAALLQSLGSGEHRPRLSGMVFNVCNMALAIYVTYATYHSRLLQIPHLEVPLMLIIAAAMFFSMSTFSVSVVISLAEEHSLRRTWRDGYFWSFPYYLFGAALAEIVSVCNHTIGWQTGLLVVPVVYLAYRSYALHLSRIEGEKKHAQEMAALHMRTIEALALAIEAKDHTTHDHLRRVQVYALEVGKELGLGPDDLEALRAAALLHDIGKLAVPEHIISKPGKLTREEFDKMKIHPVVGAEILERVRFPYPVTPIVRSHHEKWNGTGYPDGLSGEEIPIGARILSAVDCLDALASDRQYRRAVGMDEAMRKVAAESGTSFDPRVIEVLHRRCHDLERLTLANDEEPARLSTNVKIDRGSAPATGFENARSGSSAERPGDFLNSIAAAREEVQSLFELAQDLGNSLSLNETLSLVALRVKRMIPYDTLTIYAPHEDVLRPVYVTGDHSRLFSALEIPHGQGVSGWVAENRKAVINGNPAVEPGYLSDETSFTAMRSALSVPLEGLNGAVSVMTLYHAERDAFTQDNLRILLAIAPKIALAIENALKYQQAESSAATDFMTGLPNARSLFLHLDSELARCRRSGAPVVVMVCDMNGFKMVNDRFGHLEGNRLLRVVADKLKESCREYDYVARMGGDEFVLILPGLSLDQVPPKMQRLSTITKDAGREVFSIDSLSLSIGHALYPEDGTDAEQLLAEADRRMYAAKQRQKMKMSEPRGYDFDHAWSS
jgi:diguanylate cyclase (GGDEF)-like protein/putative nucleotidyltransferase with HDIG domain